MKQTLVVGLLALSLAGIFATTASSDSAVTAIRNGRVFDGKTIIPSATVLFSNGVITAVGPSVKVPHAATVIDGTGKTLLPGFIDAHTHLFPGSLERALRFGVTTELDMFTVVDLARQLRAEQKTGVANRADMLSAGTLVTVEHGHGTEYFKIPIYTPGSDPQAFIDDQNGRMVTMVDELDPQSPLPARTFAIDVFDFTLPQYEGSDQRTYESISCPAPDAVKNNPRTARP